MMSRMGIQMLQRKLASFEFKGRSLRGAFHYLSHELLGRKIIINTEILDRDTAISVSLRLKDITVSQILDAIVETTEGRYYWQQFEDSHVVSVIPRGKEKDISYPPNVTIDEFRYENITPYSCMRRAICDGLGGKLGGDWMFRGIGFTSYNHGLASV